VAAAETRHARSREHLKATAAELFARQGYRATSLDDVAAALGVRKASLYHYIASKQELLVEIYASMIDRIEAEVAPIARGDLAPAEKLRRMLLAHIGLVTAERAMLAVVVREEAELDEPHRTAMIARKREYERLYEGVVDEGQSDGAFRGLTPRLVVLALLGATNWMHQWYRPSRYSAEQVAGEFLMLLERGWLSDGDDRSRLLPLADTVDGALSGVDEAVGRLRDSMDQLARRIEYAREQLAEGLAVRHEHDASSEESAR
jgi:AcrR family transcriptional regulator